LEKAEEKNRNLQKKTVFFAFLLVSYLNKLETTIYYPYSPTSKQERKEEVMKHQFYDVKEKKKVQAEVTEKKKYGKKGNERYAFKAKTKDGRNLTAFVSKGDWDKAKI
jgi:hypothetical protein